MIKGDSSRDTFAIMKPRFSSSRNLLFGSVAVVIVGLLIFQWQTLSTLRHENQRRLAATQERQGLSRESGAEEGQRADREEIERLRRENKDLHKLRNEVAQLRQQKPELEMARAENLRLHQARQAREQLQHLSDQPGYVPNTSWIDAGFGSPEATTRTFCWALREGKFDRVLDCLAPAIRQTAGQEFVNPSEQQRKEVSSFMSQFKGYRLTEKTMVNENEVIFGVQAAPFGEKVVKVAVKRFGNDWRISGEPDTRK
jgi:TolA-binding protein